MIKESISSRSTVSRRTFLAGAGAAAGIAALAGITGCAPSTTAEKASESGQTADSYVYAKKQSDVSDREQLSTDVLVVGGGGAGI